MTQPLQLIYPASSLDIWVVPEPEEKACKGNQQLLEYILKTIYKGEQSN